MSDHIAGQHLARRKKLIATLVAAGLLVTALSLGVGYWRSLRAGRDQGLSVPQPLPTDVNQQLSGYAFTRSEGGRQVFTIRASRLVALKGGETSVLADVELELFGRSGLRRDILRTQRCEYNAVSGNMVASGPVYIELNTRAVSVPGASLRGRQRVQLETSAVSYWQQGSRVETDEPVNFQVGALVGSARGLTYATQQEVVELNNDVRMELPPRPGASPPWPVRLTASRLQYDKNQGTVTLWGPLEVVQGDRRVQAQQGTVFLNSENRVTHVALQDDVRGLDSSSEAVLDVRARRFQGLFDPAGGGLKSIVADGDVHAESRQKDRTVKLTARQVDLAFQGYHPRRVAGSAKGKVELVMDGRAAAPAGTVSARPERRSLTASQLDFTFRPGGRSFQTAQTAGAAKIVLASADNEEGSRTITAGRFQMEFDDRSRLETLRGLAPTRILFEPSPQAASGALPQETTAEHLEATFDPVLQTLRSAVQRGDFRFREGSRQARADQASYLDSTQVMTLTGHPQAWDDDTRIKAEMILIDRRANTAEGVGSVQSSYLEGGADAEKNRLPTNVLAERVKAYWRTQVLHYEGKVRSWRGADVIESPSLDVFRAERRFRSGHGVVSSHLQPASTLPGKAGAPSAQQEARPVMVRAERLEYLDAERRARYSGNVDLRTGGATLMADRLDLYFSGGANGGAREVERAVAEGKVKVVQPGREATGEQADYFAREGKIVVTGGPPALYDVEKGLTTGQRLTFFLHDDSLTVDGGDASPTLTKHRVER